MCWRKCPQGSRACVAILVVRLANAILDAVNLGLLLVSLCAGVFHLMALPLLVAWHSTLTTQPHVPLITAVFAFAFTFVVPFAPALAHAAACFALAEVSLSPLPFPLSLPPPLLPSSLHTWVGHSRTTCLRPAISCSKSSLLQREVSVLFACFSTLLLPVSRGLMPRKGWSQLDVPSGWVQIIRGPRPRSVQWPRAPAQRPHLRRMFSNLVSQRRFRSGACTFTQPFTRDSRRGGSRRSEAVHEALRVARNKTKLPPIQEQVESCKSFIERARTRVLRAKAVTDRAIEQKAVCEKEVADGELRLEALQAQGANPPPPVVSSLVSELQQKIDTLVEERDALRPCPDEVGVHKNSDKWTGQGPPSLENIPPMPTTNVQDLEGWLSDRNCDLRNAMEFGDSSLMAKIGLLVGQGATQLGQLGQDVSMQDHSKSSMMSSLSTQQTRSANVSPQAVRAVPNSDQKIPLWASGGSVKSRASADTCTCSHGTGGRGRGNIELLGSCRHSH